MNNLKIQIELTQQEIEVISNYLKIEENIAMPSIEDIKEDILFIIKERILFMKNQTKK